MINKDTQLCMSLSGRPGNFGTTFHNYLYQKLGINFILSLIHICMGGDVWRLVVPSNGDFLPGHHHHYYVYQRIA